MDTQYIVDNILQFITLHWRVLFLVFLVLLPLLYFQKMKGGDTFNLKDMVTDQETGKASLDKIVVFFFSLLSAWVIVVFVLDGKNVETLLFGVLSIFILNKAATTVIDSNKNSSKKE